MTTNECLEYLLPHVSCHMLSLVQVTYGIISCASSASMRLNDFVRKQDVEENINENDIIIWLIFSTYLTTCRLMVNKMSYWSHCLKQSDH